MASVREIAKQARVSKTTVSMVLRNQEGVSESMRQRVQQAVDYLRAVQEAQTAHELTTNSIGNTIPHDEDKLCSLLVLHPSNYHSSAVFHEILMGIQAAASVYRLQLNLALNDSSLLSTFENFYFSNPLLRPEGVLVIGARKEEPLVDRICELSIPVVLVGRKSHNDRVSSVGRNEIEMAAQVANHLFDLGHRRIAFLGACEKFGYCIDRLQGYRNAHSQKGLPLDEELVHYGFNIEETARFLISDPTITGAVFINELFASQVLPLVKAAGKAVPENLSVVVFDDTDISRNFDPPLTSVAYPFFQEGFWSVRLIMEHVHQPIIINSQMVLGATLVQRQSCSPAKLLH